MSKKIVGNIISEEEAARAIESYNESKKLNREALEEMVEWKRAGLPYAPGYIPKNATLAEENQQAEESIDNAKVKTKKVSVRKKASEPQLAQVVAPTKNNWRKTIAIIAVPVAVISLIFNVIQYQNSTALQATNKELQAQNKEYSERIDSITGRNADLAYKNSELERKNATYSMENTGLRIDLEWYQGNFGLKTNPYGNCAYHKLDCHHLGDYVYFDTIQELEQRGCWPCSDCYR